jgi:hypothetical protein
MEINLNRLNLADLKNLYQKSQRQLQEELLEGASWHETKYIRDIITEISIEIHEKQFAGSGFSPAEFNSREH